MTTVTVSMIVSRWPQLVRPTAVCFLAKAVQEGLTILAGLARLVSLGRSLFDATRGFADLGIPSSPGVGVSIVIGASSLLFLLWSFSFLFLKAADAEAVTRLYTDDGVLMAQESPPAVGSAAVRSAYVGLFQMIGLDITFHVAEVVELTPEWAFARTTSTGMIKVNATGTRSPRPTRNCSFSRRQSLGPGRSPGTAFPSSTRLRSNELPHSRPGEDVCRRNQR